MKMGPNLFLVSAPRCGSTQLSAWLASHPDVSISPIKEPNFFSSHEFPEDYVRTNHLNDVDPAQYVKSGSRKSMQFAVFRDLEHYEYLFAGLNTRYRMDASTTYMHCPEAAPGIRDYAPDARIILLTRDPVARALSHYRLAVRIGRTTRTLREEIEAEASGDTPLPGRFLLRQSRYAEALAAYRNAFPETHRLEISFEDMVREPQRELARISEFLCVPQGGFNMALESQNAGDAPRFRALNAWLLRSGLKTQLRRALPRSMKQKIKAVYFKDNSEEFLDNDTDLLRRSL